MYRVFLCVLATTALAGSVASAQPYPTGYSRSVGVAASADSQRPTRYVAARSSLGGGLIEAIFGGASDVGRGAAGEAANPYGGHYVPPDPAETSRYAVDPQYRPQVVEYTGGEAPGTVVVDTRHFFLYLVEGGGKAMRYGVGVGRPGYTWAGVHSITAKREWPDWRPPAEMLQRAPQLPQFMAGGPENPLGARALYLGDTLYRIHGSNEPWTIGTQVSSGCIRMRNEDVMDLFERVKVGTKVVVL